MNTNIDNLVLGLLAHVDAGKTTLSEAMLYLNGQIRKMGRVDTGDAFFDNYIVERERCITIFSKQARLSFKCRKITLIDTPGHVDFSAEMERTLQVLDYAVLIISASDGVQGHTRTLWSLLARYNIPTFIFVNKMDQPNTESDKVLSEIRSKLDERCIAFDNRDVSDLSLDEMETISMCDEQTMDSYLKNGKIDLEDIRHLIKERKLFPCFFGSALRLQGIDTLLNAIETYSIPNSYPTSFGAKVYKVSRDKQGNRLTHLKITGGTLKVKDLMTNKKSEANHIEEFWEEKINQICVYLGERYESVSEVSAGDICAVLGLNYTYPGQGLGIESDSDLPLLEPVLTYQIILNENNDYNGMISKLKQIEEEEPQLYIAWNEQLKEIQVQLMGEVQIDVLKNMIWERFGIEVEFGKGNIVYKETIADTVEGVGHFEPLKHYAEVHLKMEPSDLGSGLQFETQLSEDDLDKNWQKLILTHLEERQHKGVLVGADITDMKITLVAGKAHQKHTEGGDFRQATYRAVRQGLMQAKNVLLEPYYEFRLEIPQENIGRAMTDIERMYGKCNTPNILDGVATLIGIAPVSAIREYHNEVTSYTKGLGRLICTLKGYAPCHNTKEVIDSINYDIESDFKNPSGSVFCAHGECFTVDWHEVKDYMHIQSAIKQTNRDDRIVSTRNQSGRSKDRHSIKDTIQLEDELKTIFERTYGPMKQHEDSRAKRVTFRPKEVEYKGVKRQRDAQEYLLVDGYNVIFAWEDLKELAILNMDAARDKLLDIMCNYQGYKQCNLIVVFDAYKVKGFKGEATKYHNIEVVFTKEAETADQYIEKLAHNIGRKHDVTVATSDALEQMIIMGQGCKRLSSRDLKIEVERLNQYLREEYLENKPQKNLTHNIFDINR